MRISDWSSDVCSSDLADIFVGNSGLSIRTLVAVLAFMGGHYRLSGVPRMHQRPIGDLVDALRPLGARIRYLQQEGFPPLSIESAQERTVAPVRVQIGRAHV